MNENEDLRPASDTMIVVTSIQAPTACMRRLAEEARRHAFSWVVIGDRKGPARFDLEPAELVPISTQRDLPFRLAGSLPERHYARKNLGYLLAMARGCARLYETDDDNAPTSRWTPRPREVEARRLLPHEPSARGWANVYSLFTTEKIWPRGLPLDRVRDRLADRFAPGAETVRVEAPIQQGLADGAPDVDAIWRLVLDRDFTFEDRPGVMLPAGVWCPFNSQNTWWWSDVYPLLYLPSHCSFRMTDIWRSFVAQRCLWELGHELEFHAADVHQLRNEHSLLRDFEDECVGYLRNDEIRALLERLPLRAGPQELMNNLHRCWDAMAVAGLVKPAEMPLVEAWLEDCREFAPLPAEATALA
jgi:hypothetical protein